MSDDENVVYARPKMMPDQVLKMERIEFRDLETQGLIESEATVADYERFVATRGEPAPAEQPNSGKDEQVILRTDGSKVGDPEFSIPDGSGEEDAGDDPAEVLNPPTIEWRKADLEKYAENFGLDIKGVTTKQEILDIIESSKS